MSRVGDMAEANKVADGLDEYQREAVRDLVRCPGLFAGQYDDLDELPPGLVLRSFDGPAGFLGLARARPSPLAIMVEGILS